MFYTTLVLALALVQPPASAAPVSGAASVNAVESHMQKHPRQKSSAVRAKPTAARDVDRSPRSTGAARAKAAAAPAVPAVPVVAPAAKVKPAAKTATTPAVRGK